MTVIKQITRKQHYVPRFYLKSWLIPGLDKVWTYDLYHNKIKNLSPSSIVFENYYYEHDRDFPDNSIEDVLKKMEDKTAPILQEMNSIVQQHPNFSQEKQLTRALQDFLVEEKRKQIKEFAAYQYLRIPGAMERKAYELIPAKIPDEELREQLKPANFVTTGFDYVRNKFFQKLRMLLSCSFDYEFLTSDWPCFDFMHSPYAPALGVDIGNSRGVFLIFPLLPRVLLTLFSRSISPGVLSPPEPIVRPISAGEVRNTNTLTIQQARRWVIYNKNVDFVLKVARNS
ncbi:DUF4238 domain-containing protein [Desulfomonile tiedjei]|uniref:DUF4238 domain-containing protein n=1 Tax=Desulfomonile tiedjei (strain ATCC 49306 / DSM 6799 / DCB-1) TaxID=706587 RepID=I4C5M5_DESTA|nr:DUF4238 domain-containing protein [Desulfomonile tiedjei]AFM24866.1 hypothetical protein Desti_2169 [Desulfomonile tiedjei DSM 6799]